MQSSAEQKQSAHGSGALPTNAPMPSALQTLGCRWWPLQYVEWCRQHIGPRFTVYPIDMPPLVFISDPEEIHAVVTAPADVLHPGAGSSPITPLIGDEAFILSEEDEHLCGRNATVPAFRRQAVEAHTSMVATTVAEQLASWPTDRVLAAHGPIRTTTLSAVLKAMFPEEEKEVLRKLAESALKMLSITATILLQEPRLRHLPGWRARWRRFLKDREQVDELVYQIIGRRRCMSSAPGDLLDALLAAKNPDGGAMSDKQVRDHLMSMIVAGHETTAAEVAWAIQLLAHHPAAQERIAHELDDGGEQQPYLEATVLETLRHRPAFLFAIPREVIEPVEIGGWIYPVGAHLVPCTYLMHHDPTLYRSPDAFRPERFLDGKPPAGAWLPWGAGRKRCVGRHFALIEMQAILRGIIATRRILPARSKIEHPRWRSAILVPHAGCRIVLHKRDPRNERNSRRRARDGTVTAPLAPSVAA